MQDNYYVKHNQITHFSEHCNQGILGNSISYHFSSFSDYAVCDVINNSYTIVTDLLTIKKDALVKCL